MNQWNKGLAKSDAVWREMHTLQIYETTNIPTEGIQCDKVITREGAIKPPPENPMVSNEEAYLEWMRCYWHLITVLFLLTSV